jgi:polar amino acid transport system substrate-binding protein
MMTRLDDPQRSLCFAINLGNPVLATLLPDNTPGGITAELAKKLAAECGCEARFVTWPTAGKVVDVALLDQWDIAFLAIDPAREDKLCFTPPYVTIESSVLVRNDSDIHSVQAMDRPGVTINVGRGAAYELYLIRTLRHAAMQQYATSQEAIRAFIAGEGDGCRDPSAACQRGAGISPVSPPA